MLEYSQLILLVFLASISIGLVIHLFQNENEAAIDYKVPIPDHCASQSIANAEILVNPSIKISGSSVIQCYCPANGKLLGRVNPTTPEGIDRAIAQAGDAQLLWAKSTFATRRKVLRTLLNFILKHQDEIVTAACLDSGKTKVDASLGEILVTAEKLKWTIKHGEKALADSRRPTNFLMFYKRNVVLWEPLGVVAACVSWNYPFHNLLGPIIAALFTGNAIVVKCSEQTAWSAPFFTSIVRGALVACNQSPDLVQSIVCWPATASHLTSHPSISHITFIGSRPVAHLVVASAAKSLTPVCVELGGKDAAIVLDDTKDLNKVTSILMRGVFQSAGQNCIGIERVVALPQIYERLVPILKQRISLLRVGSVLDDEERVDVGSCISSANFDKLERLVEEAVSRGASLLCGGRRFVHPEYPNGHFFSPTLLVGVTRDMPIAQQELFAPIFVLMRADTVADAISITNSTQYGLGCSVFGENKSALETVVGQVKAGMVSVNDFAVYYMCGLPFGGVKGSGYGRFGGAEGLQSLCNLKSVCRDRWGSIISTSIPPRLDYPLTDTAAGASMGNKRKAWELTKGIVSIGYAPGLRNTAGAVRQILKNV